MSEAKTQADNMTLEQIIALLPGIKEVALKSREILLANLVMLGEIPAPSFAESERIQCLEDRFVMCGLQNCSTDEMGNALAVIPGTEKSEIERNIMIVAHADTVYDKSIDHTVSVQPDKITGFGLSDNALGLAVLVTLPVILEALQIKLKSNLVLMGATGSLGRSNLQGLRFFLENTELPIHSGICIEGLQLNRLNYSSIGMLRGEIRCSMLKEYDWVNKEVVGAIAILNDIISGISAIRLPMRPKSSIILGMVRGGTGYNRIALKSSLRFEIRSESAEVVAELRTQVEDIVFEVSSQSGVEVTLNFFAQRTPGSLGFSHTLVKAIREIQSSLQVKTRISPSISELSIFIDHKIPAVTLGITRGENNEDEQDILEIAPMFTGIAQLVASILAIDNGYCDEY